MLPKDVTPADTRCRRIIKWPMRIDEIRRKSAVWQAGASLKPTEVLPCGARIAQISAAG